MNENRYIDFFENMEIFKNKQLKQKQRGLNDYNLLTTVLNEYDEVRLHSRVIGSMLDIDGLHYQGSLFLEKLFEVLNITNFEFDINSSKITLEYNNIDLYLTDGQKHIIIENKIYAGDQEKQIERYINIIKKDNENIEYNDILVIYLSINRRNPSEYSLGSLKIKDKLIYTENEKIAIFKNINYKYEIINWLKICINEIQNITNLNESFLQYLSVVEKITNNYKEKVMPTKNFLLNDDNLKLAIELEDPIKDAKAQIQHDFWITLQKELKYKGYPFEFVNGSFEKITNLEKQVHDYYHSSRNNRYFGLKKDLLKINESHTLSFYIEVDWHVYYGFTFSKDGVRKDLSGDEEIKIITEKISSQISSTWNGPNNNNQKDWICWKLANKTNKINFNSFTSDIVFDLNNEEKKIKIINDIVDEIIEVINKTNIQ